jgi:hypothetical protein
MKAVQIQTSIVQSIEIAKVVCIAAQTIWVVALTVDALRTAI